MEGFQNRKGQDLQRPFAGCMGRMINIFDLSVGMTGAKLLTEKAHRDGSPVVRNQSDAMKMPIDLASVQRKEKQTASELWKSSSNKRLGGGTPMKMLIEQEMLKEVESKQNPPNVVARLMGLDGLPIQQSEIISRNSSGEDYPLDGLARDHRMCEQQENKYPQHSMSHKHQSCTQGNKKYKDVYEVLPSRISSQHKNPVNGKYEENTYEKRMDLIRQKFIQAKHLAEDEKLLHSNEFQETLQALSSNKDLFIKFLEEPNSLFSKHLHELRTVAPPSEINRITVLKPSKSIEMKGSKIMGKQLDLHGHGSEYDRSNHYRSSSCSTKTHVLSQPTRIVVLKPSLRKSHDIKNVTFSPISSPTSVEGEGRESYEVQEADEIIGSREVAKEITRQVRQNLKCKQRGERPFSSIYSNGFIEPGSSFKWSESENMDEGDSELNGWEIRTPTSYHLCDNKSRPGSPYSVSSFSHTSHSIESSVVKEAKKRLSERWAMVASNAYSQEEKEARRSSSTLGEMLAIPEVKKEQERDGSITLSNSPCEHDMIEPSSCLSAGWTKGESNQENANNNLSRSKSLPVCTSVYDDVGLNCEPSDSLSGNLKEADRSKSGKSLFMETVSSFFLSRNKKPVRQKSIPSTSVGSNNWVQHNCFLAVGTVNDDINQCILNSQQKQTTLLDTENKIAKSPATSHYDIPDKGTISAKDFSSTDKLRMSGNFLDTQDQPSPISVLEAPFIDDSAYTLQKLSDSSSAGIPQTLSRSPRIESVARSLSWDSSQYEVTSPNSLRLSRVFSKADEEQKRFAFIQNLVWSAGLDAESPSTKYLRWYTPERPLSPFLLDEYCGDKEVKIREKQSKERLLYDSVNEALIEIGQTTLLATYPWTRNCMWTCKGCSGDSGSSVADEVWAVIRNWSSFEKYFTWDSNNSSLVVDLMVKREITGRMWVETIWFEMFDVNKEICGMVLEELVEEAILDLSCW